MRVAVFFLLGVFASAQALPDTPSAACDRACEVRRAAPVFTCIGPNGCGWKQVKAVPHAPVTFWSFRGVVVVNGKKRFDWNAPPLRTNRQAFDKKFVILHGLAFAAMTVACSRKNSGEEWGSEVPAILFGVGGDYVLSRFFSEAMSVEIPPYQIQHYIRSAAK